MRSKWVRESSGRGRYRGEEGGYYEAIAKWQGKRRGWEVNYKTREWMRWRRGRQNGGVKGTRTTRFKQDVKRGSEREREGWETRGEQCATSKESRMEEGGENEWKREAGVREMEGGKQVNDSFDRIDTTEPEISTFFNFFLFKTCCLHYPQCHLATDHFEKKKKTESQWSHTSIKTGLKYIVSLLKNIPSNFLSQMGMVVFSRHNFNRSK